MHFFRIAFFLKAVLQHFPDRFDAPGELYKRGWAGNAFKDELYPMVHDLKKEYSLSGSYQTDQRKDAYSMKKVWQK
ncbi:MAG: hypothetical protein ACOC4C_03195 [Fibrobacterota bacterium]